MTKRYDFLSQITKEETQEVIENSHCISRVIENFGLPMNGTSQRVVTQIIKKFEISTSHFDVKHLTRKRHKIEKSCPVCEKKFPTQTGKDEKTVCSLKCSNTFFRSGDNNGRRKKALLDGFDSNTFYRRICWQHHKKECIICGENLVVAVHHYNENHEDNRPENLVPLCPTHHQYLHSKHANLIKERVDNFVITFVRQRFLVLLACSLTEKHSSVKRVHESSILSLPAK